MPRVRRGHRDLLTVTVLIALALGTGPSVATSSPPDDGVAKDGKTVKHVGQILTKDVGDAGGCQRTVFFQWAELPGATSYDLDMNDTGGYSFTDTYPPYIAEHEGEFGGNPPVAKGQHRIAMTYQAGPSCDGFADDAARFKVNSFTATFDGKSRIVGTVTQRDDAPVRNIPISITGPSPSTQKTNKGGAYGVKVKEGRYTVKAPFGFCVRGGGKCSREKSISVNGTESVHFVAGGEAILSGQVFRRQCADTACYELDVVPLPDQTVVAIGDDGEQVSAVTDAKGKYELGVKLGIKYKVKYPISPNVSPKRYTVTAREDVDNLNFELCDTPIEYAGEDVDCRIVRVDGEVVDRDGRPYAGALVSGPGDQAVANRKGRFSLFVPRGSVMIVAEGLLIARTSNHIGAFDRVNETRLKLFTILRFSQATRTSIAFLTDALPTKHGGGKFELAIEREKGDLTGCRFRQRVLFHPTDGRYANFEITPNQGYSEFCPGKYAANVYDPDGRELQTRLFTID